MSFPYLHVDLLRDSPAVGKTHEAMAARHATVSSTSFLMFFSSHLNRPGGYTCSHLVSCSTLTLSTESFDILFVVFKCPYTSL